MSRKTLHVAMFCMAVVAAGACASVTSEPGDPLDDVTRTSANLGVSGHEALLPAASQDAGAAELAQGEIRFTAIATGFEHTCAIVTDGSVRCWGDNSYGQIGQSEVTQVTKPTLVPGVRDAKQIIAGDSHTCVLLRDGTVRCWGDNTFGQLGDGTFTARSAPGLVMRSQRSVLRDVSSIASGARHNCALIKGRVRCWGTNEVHALGAGKGTLPASATPLPVYGRKADGNWMELRGVSAIAAGFYHSCAIIKGGARCWGWNSSGQLGIGTKGKDQGVAVSAVGVQGKDPLGGVTSLTAGYYHTCVAANDGALCWGDNSGQLGNPYYTESARPVVVLSPYDDSALSGVHAVEASAFATCAIVGAERGAVCWGVEQVGELGNGEGTSHTRRPMPVLDLSDAESLSGYYLHFCAKLSDGRARCWGHNNRGQLGNGTTIGAQSPVDVLQDEP